MLARRYPHTISLRERCSDDAKSLVAFNEVHRGGRLA